MKNLNKKMILCICLLFLALNFHQVFAGTCGNNVKYTVSGNTISFSKANSGSNAVWGSDCGAVFKNDEKIKIMKVTETIYVENAHEMFRDFRYIEEMYLSNLDVSAVSDMSGMFEMEWDSQHQKYLISLKKLDVSGWNTANVTDMFEMFRGCSGLTALDVGSWNTGKVTSMGYMFYNCSGLTALDVGSWNTGKVKYMYSMFRGCSGLTSVDLGSWDTANVTQMNSMFSGCRGLTALDVGSWNTANVTSMSNMFLNCSGLTALDLGSWNTGNVTSMYSMFHGCSGLTALDLGSWDTGNVTNMYSMFSGCSGLTALDVGSWNTGNVKYMDDMFYNCSGLTSLEVASWNTANVIYMGGVFEGCSSLHTLTLGKNSLEKNIFVTLPAYNDIWYYVARRDEATNPLALYTEKTGASLFASYNYTTMAGTWTTELLADAVNIQNSSGTDVTGKKVTTNLASYNLKAVITPSAASQTVSWKSNATGTATVDSTGKVTFKKTGTVTVTATASDGSGRSAWVKLTYAGPTAVSIQNASGTDITGKTLTVSSTAHQLKAAAAPAGALQKFTWKSSDTGIGAVDSNGKVTFRKTGTVTVTATASDGSGRLAWVKLTLVPVIKIQNTSGTDITGKTVTIHAATYQLKTAITPSIASQTVTWKSSDTVVAAVSTAGKVTFKKPVR